jgi:hypothetical protein
MATVTLHRQEWEQGLLPDLCVVCGEFADRRMVEFAWVHRVPLPVCGDHRYYARFRENVVAIWGLVLLVSIVASVFWIGLSGPRTDLVWQVLLILPVMGLFGFLAWNLWKLLSVRARRYDGHNLELTGVSTDFVSALNAIRDRLAVDSDSRTSWS